MDWLDLLDEAGGGQGEAMDQLVEVLYPMVRGRVRRRLGSGQSSYAAGLLEAGSLDDLVQEVILRVVGGLARFVGRDLQTLGKFVDVLTENTLLDLWRYQRAARRRAWFEAREPLRKALPVGDCDAPLAAATQKEEVGLCREALASFSERDRQLLRGRLEGDLSFGEIAHEIGYPTPDAARKAWDVAYAKLLFRVRALGLSV